MTRAERILEAEKTVAATIRRLPADLRGPAQAVPVLYERRPKDDVLAEGFEPDILGLFSGSAHGTEFDGSAPAPPRILLYLDNLWDYAEGDPEIFHDEVRLTYLHELGVNFQEVVPLVRS